VWCILLLINSRNALFDNLKDWEDRGFNAMPGHHGEGTASAIGARRRPGVSDYSLQLTVLVTWSAAAILSVYGAVASENPLLWLTCALTLPVGYWVMGGGRSYPILLCILGLYWLQVFADVLGANLRGAVIGEGMSGPYELDAVELSLGALLVMALGMRFGVMSYSQAGRNRVPSVAASSKLEGIRLSRVVVAYFVAVFFVVILAQVANALPALRQPILGFALLKYVCLYLLAIKVFESRGGYHWLAIALLFEVITGLTGYIASYQRSILVLLIAGLSQSRFRKELTLQRILIFVGATAVLLWTSIVWTAVKSEYRDWGNSGTGSQIIDRPFSERVQWLANRLAAGNIDYKNGFEQLVLRVGYTSYYAQTLARLDAGLVPSDLHLWSSAILHVVTPRALFSEKAALSDSAITTLLTNNEFDVNTSASVGWVAEAQVDYGFPGMFLPILLVGIMLGAAIKYFMTRTVPRGVCEAFATSCLVLTFRYEANVDNALGGFLTGFIALALVLRFGYPRIARWLSGRRVRGPV
jgi:hypothetical protein